MRLPKLLWIPGLALHVLLNGLAGGRDASAGAPSAKRSEIVLADDAPAWQKEPFAGCAALGYDILQGPRLQAGLPRRIGMIFEPDGSALLVSEKLLLHLDTQGTVRLLAGRPGVSGHQDGPAPLARFSALSGAARCGDGGFFLNDRGNVCFRRLYRKEDGSWWAETVAGVPGTRGRKDGPAQEALFQNPCNLAVNSKGELFTCDKDYLRKLAGGQVTTLNPNGGTGFADGPLASAKFSLIMGAGCAFDDQDDLYIADRWNNRFRKVDFKTGQVSTYAGSGRRAHHVDGPFAECAVEPGGLWWDPRRKSFYVQLVDSDNLARLENGWLKTVIPHCGMVGLDAEGQLYGSGGRDEAYRLSKYVLNAASANKDGRTAPAEKGGRP